MKLIKTILKFVPHSMSEIRIKTDIFDNGDNKPDKSSRFIKQRIILQSAGNQAVLELYADTLTPKFLRELANDIEMAMNT